MFINGYLKSGLQNISRQTSRNIKQHKKQYTKSWLDLTQSRPFASNTEIEKKRLSELGKKEYNQIYMGGVDSIVARRRAQHEYVTKREKAKNEIAAIYQGPSSIVVEFELFMLHDEKESQQAEAVLNYYDISFKRNQNFLYAQYMRDKINYDLKIPKDDIKIPILSVSISIEPTIYIFGLNNITKYLKDHNFILETKHLTNSAVAQQSCQFAKDQLEKNLDALFWSPVLTWQNLAKTAPETYKRGTKNYILLKTMRLTFARIIKNIAKNYKKKINNREEYISAKENLLVNLKEWESRLNGKDFHGGEEPDEADFEVYSILKAKSNSHSFNRFLEDEVSRRVYGWYIRMQMKCRYNPDRLMVAGL